LPGCADDRARYRQLKRELRLDHYEVSGFKGGSRGGSVVFVDESAEQVMAFDSSGVRFVSRGGWLWRVQREAARGSQSGHSARIVRTRRSA
jgi:hypothetical protein